MFMLHYGKTGLGEIDVGHVADADFSNAASTGAAVAEGPPLPTIGPGDETQAGAVPYEQLPRLGLGDVTVRKFAIRVRLAWHGSNLQFDSDRNFVYHYI
jgi:hypothetical protein